MSRKPSPEMMSEGDADGLVCGYVRVSGEHQAENGHSLPIQRQQITAYCQKENLTLTEIYEDAAISGSEISTRPALLRLIEDARAKKFSRVLVSKIDRLSRNTLWTLWLQKELLKSDVQLFSLAEPYLWSDPTQKIFLTLISSFAEWEKHRLLDRMMGGREKKFSNGQFAGGGVALGYQTDSNGELEINADEANVVREIYRLRLGRKSLRKIADSLNERGFKTKRGGKFYQSTVRYVLKNETYRGIIKLNRKNKGIHPQIRYSPSIK